MEQIRHRQGDRLQLAAGVLVVTVMWITKMVVLVVQDIIIAVLVLKVVAEEVLLDMAIQVEQEEHINRMIMQ